MSRAASTARRLARKLKSEERSRAKPERKKRNEQKLAAEAADRAEAARLDQERWRACLYHGQSVASSDEIVMVEGARSFLYRLAEREPIIALKCGEWWHVTKHP